MSFPPTFDRTVVLRIKYACDAYFTSKLAVREAATICPRPLQVDLWPLTFWPWKWCPSQVCVTWVTSLFANFSLPRPLCSRLRPDVRDRQTDVRRTSSLNDPYPSGRCITSAAPMLNNMILVRMLYVLHVNKRATNKIGDVVHEIRWNNKRNKLLMNSGLDLP